MSPYARTPIQLDIFQQSCLQLEVSLQSNSISRVSFQAKSSLKRGNSSAFVPAQSLTFLFTVLIGIAVTQSQSGIFEM